MFGASLMFAHLTALGAAPLPTVVVVPFATSSAPEYAAIGPGAALEISAQLLEAKEVNLVSQSELSQLLRLHDQTVEGVQRGTAVVELARVLGADLVITGSYQARWPDIQLILRIVNAKDGTVKTEQWELAKLEETPAAIQRMLARAFPAVGWAKPKASALGTSNVYAWREAALAAEIFALQPFSARPRALLSASAVRKARLHAEEAIKLDPKWGFAHACRALAAALHAVAEHDKADAGLALEEAKKAGVAQVFAAYASYLARLERGEEKEAIAAIDAARERVPGMLALLELAAEFHQIRGAHAEAKKVLARAPEVPALLAMLGKSEVALGDGAKGLAVTEKAVALSDSDVSMLVELGSRLIDLGRLPEAEAALGKALARDARDGRAYLRLGYVYLLQKNAAKAIAVLERSIAESNLEDEWRARAIAHFDLARAHAQSGALEKAFTELGLAIDNGFEDRAAVEREEDLAALRKDARWNGVVEKLRR